MEVSEEVDMQFERFEESFVSFGKHYTGTSREWTDGVEVVWKVNDGLINVKTLSWTGRPEARKRTRRGTPIHRNHKVGGGGSGLVETP